MTFRLQNLLLPGSKPRIVLLHLICWCIFISYEMLTLYFINGHLGKFADAMLYYALYALLFYLNALAVLPFAKRIKGLAFLAGSGLVLSEIALFFCFKYVLDRYVEGYRLPSRDPLIVTRYVVLACWREFYFIGFSTAYWLIRSLFAYRQEIAGVRQAYLQQQISPHFLFNTLNFMYNAVYQLAPGVAEYILQLSDMMRYSFAEPDLNGKTLLNDELEQIRNFISISRRRYDFQLYLDLHILVVPENARIIPLILLTLTENVCKHGNLKEKEHPARISLSVDENNLLTFTTRNQKKRQNTERRLKRIGLQNTIKRLDYAYGGQYRLDIRDEAETYELDLYLQL